MDITVYLPDELGKWAKDHDLPLSRMLRDAADHERQRQQTITSTLADAETHDLTVEDDDGNPYTARLHGTLIAQEEHGPNHDTYVYVGKDEAIYIYHEPSSKLHQDADHDDLRDWLSDDPYAAAMRALGEDVVIDIGLPS